MKLSERVLQLQGAQIGQFDMKKWPILSESIPMMCPGCNMTYGLPLRRAINCMIESGNHINEIEDFLNKHGYNHEESKDDSTRRSC